MDGYLKEYFIFDVSGIVFVFVQWNDDVMVMLDVINLFVRLWIIGKMMILIDRYKIQFFKMMYGKFIWFLFYLIFYKWDIIFNKLKKDFIDMLVFFYELNVDIIEGILYI